MTEVGSMNEWLTFLSEKTIVAVDGLALIVIIFGTIEVFIGVLWLLMHRGSPHDERALWLRYSRWLVAALTFQLAADLIETSISTNWQTIGRVGAIAVIRTFLNFFLERDLEEVRRRQRDSAPQPAKVA
jgi:uncharacterized membrane protein